MTDLLDATGIKVLPPVADAVLTSSVLVIEEDALVAQAVLRALQAAGFQAGACPPGSGTSILEQAASFAPRVVLLDLLRSGSTTSAPCLVASLRALGAQVIAFTSATDPLLLGAVIEAGVSDVVSKAAPVHELLEAVAGCMSGESRLGVSYRAAMMQQFRRDRAEQRARLAPFDTLTRREPAVLGHMMEGDAAEAIAAACFVSLATVRSQIRAVLTKLSVNSQLAAVAMAYRAGWTPVPGPHL